MRDVCSTTRTTLVLLLLLVGQPASAFTNTHFVLPHHRQEQRLSLSELSSLRRTTRSWNKRRSTAGATTTTSTTRLLLEASSSIPSALLPFSRRVSQLLTGPNPHRPEWTPQWLPTWVVNMRAPFQLVTLLALYIFHLTVLTQRSIPFPFQLIPNERGHFQSVGLDS
jgi:hypothetical protein